MASVVVVTGSARPNSVNHKVVALTKAQLEARGPKWWSRMSRRLVCRFLMRPFPHHHQILSQSMTV